MGIKRWFKIALLALILNTLENIVLIGFLGVFNQRNLILTVGFSIVMAIIIELFLKD